MYIQIEVKLPTGYEHLMFPRSSKPEEVLYEIDLQREIVDALRAKLDSEEQRIPYLLSDLRHVVEREKSIAARIAAELSQSEPANPKCQCILPDCSDDTPALSNLCPKHQL